MSPEEFRAQREPWEAFVRSADAHERLQELAAEAARRELAEAGLELRALAADLAGGARGARGAPRDDVVARDRAASGG